MNILVTGAGRDIGAAVARRIVGADGYALLHAAGSSEGAEASLALIRAVGADGAVLNADFRDDAAVAAFIADAIQTLSGRRLDAIVLNAAFTAAVPIGQPALSEWRAMLDVNVLAPQRIVDALEPHMSDGGAIIALSIAATRHVFDASFGFFTATKAATDALVRHWAVAYGPRGIRANSVAPGVIDANFRSSLLKDPAFRDPLIATTALRRTGEIDDVVDVVAFLVSDASRWITGSVIDASGGWEL